MGRIRRVWVMASSSSWAILLGVVAVALAAVWYDAHNASAHADARTMVTEAQAFR
jgi:hypothetical protein